MNHQNKAEMSTTKLLMMFALLLSIWVLCYKAENQLPDRFQQDFKERIGAQPIDPVLVAQAKYIKNGQDLQKNKQIYNTYLKQKYGGAKDKQLQICVIVIDDKASQSSDEQIYTIKSIITQNYKNFQISYLSFGADPSIKKVQSYLNDNQISDTKYTIIDSFNGKISDLEKGTNKCSDDSLIMILNSGQILITQNVFQLLNNQFAGTAKPWIAWANTLYSNDKLGFSINYPQKIIDKNSYRKYPFLANEAVVFYKKLFILVPRKMFEKQANIQYNYKTKAAYVLPMLQLAGSKVTYIPQILTIQKNLQKSARDSKSKEIELEREIQQKKSDLTPLNNLF